VATLPKRQTDPGFRFPDDDKPAPSLPELPPQLDFPFEPFEPDSVNTPRYQSRPAYVSPAPETEATLRAALNSEEHLLLGGMGEKPPAPPGYGFKRGGINTGSESSKTKPDDGQYSLAVFTRELKRRGYDEATRNHILEVMSHLQPSLQVPIRWLLHWA
jgi:hypothetical protein